MPAVFSPHSSALAHRRMPSTKAVRGTSAPYHVRIRVPMRAGPLKVPVPFEQAQERVEKSPTQGSFWSDGEDITTCRMYPGTSPSPDIESPLPAPIGEGRPSVVSPASTEEWDEKHARLLPLAEWVVDFMLQHMEAGILPKDPRFPSRHRRFLKFETVERIHLIFLSMTMPPACIFYALYYAEKILRGAGAAGTLGRRFWGALYGDTPLSPEIVVIRAFAVGLMLADKFLNDSTFHTKTWNTCAQIPIATLNTMERYGLRLMGFQLRISDDEWWHWLEHIAYLHSISDFDDESYELVRRTIEGLVAQACSPKPVPKTEAQPVESEWNPSADPLVPKASKAHGHGPRKSQDWGASVEYPVLSGAQMKQQALVDPPAAYRGETLPGVEALLSNTQPTKLYPTATEEMLSRPSRYW